MLNELKIQDYHIRFRDLDNIAKSIPRLFGRCSRIGRVVFNMKDIDISEETAIRTIMSTLTGVKFDELAFETLHFFNELTA